MNTEYKSSFKKDEPENLTLSVYNCGLQKCESGYTWGPGIRDHYLIHLVLSGKGCYVAGDKEHTLTIGYLFFSKPGQKISYTADTRRPWEYIWVGFNGAYASRLSPFLPFNEERPFYRLPEKDFEETKTLMKNIYLSRGSEISQSTQMTGHLYLFLSQLLRKGQQTNKTPKTTGAEYVDNTIKFIQFNYSQDININDISRAVGVSRSHLYRTFMSVVGQSLVDYLTNYRIGEACTLLESTSLAVSEVAYSVGIFDPFYFSRVFKKIKGMPPSLYQKIKQEAKREKLKKALERKC